MKNLLKKIIIICSAIFSSAVIAQAVPASIMYTAGEPTTGQTYNIGDVISGISGVYDAGFDDNASGGQIPRVVGRFNVGLLIRRVSTTGVPGIVQIASTTIVTGAAPVGPPRTDSFSDVSITVPINTPASSTLVDEKYVLVLTIHSVSEDGDADITNNPSGQFPLISTDIVITDNPIAIPTISHMDPPTLITTDGTTFDKDRILAYENFPPETSFTVFNQFNDNTGTQFGGGGVSFTTPAASAGETTVSGTVDLNSLSVFGSPSLVSGTAVTWNSNINAPLNISTLSNLTVDSTLSNTQFEKGDLTGQFGPNPATDTITFTPTLKTTTYSVADLSGATIKTVEATGTLDVSDLPSGIYFLITDAGVAKFQKK